MVTQESRSLFRCLTLNQTEEPKTEVMSQLAREACEARESAARCGEQPPQWVQTFMSPAGWECYHQLREEAGDPHEAALAGPEPVPHTGG